MPVLVVVAELESVTVDVSTEVGRTGALAPLLELEEVVWVEEGTTVDGVDEVVEGEEVELVIVGKGAGTTMELVEVVGTAEVGVSMLVLVGVAVTVGSIITVTVEPLAPMELSARSPRSAQSS